MSETVLIRMIGGPHEGDRYGNASLLGGWPLPEVLEDAGGRYVKVSESQLPDPPSTPHLLRGAQYQWEPEIESS